MNHKSEPITDISDERMNTVANQRCLRLRSTVLKVDSTEVDPF